LFGVEYEPNFQGCGRLINVIDRNVTVSSVSLLDEQISQFSLTLNLLALLEIEAQVRNSLADQAIAVVCGLKPCWPRGSR